MNGYIFDSDTCIAYLRGHFDLLGRLDAIDKNHCFLSAVTVAELKVGAEICDRRERARKEVEEFVRLFNMLPIDNALDIYAQEYARLRKLGKLIDDFDLLIGATAIRHGLTLVTNNTKHFERMENLTVENWTMETTDEIVL